MIGPGTDARVMIATRPVDFRKGRKRCFQATGVQGMSSSTRLAWLDHSVGGTSGNVRNVGASRKFASKPKSPPTCPGGA